jgi:hypothetical protein
MLYFKLRSIVAWTVPLLASGTIMMPIPALSAEIAGNAVSVAQSATLVNGQGQQRMSQGMPVAMGDRINTDGNGQVELVFTDETKLVVGPNSSMVIESYLLRSDNRANNFTVRALGGSFRFITGKSEKKAYKIKTPTATIGVRGTSFDISVRRARVTNVILLDGQAEVCSQSGCVTIEQNCGLAIAPRIDPARVVRDRTYKTGRIVDEFPYIVSEERLTEPFRVGTTACGDISKAAIKPPATTASTRRGPPEGHANDNDVSEPDRPERSRSRDDPSAPGPQSDNL